MGNGGGHARYLEDTSHSLIQGHLRYAEEASMNTRSLYVCCASLLAVGAFACGATDGTTGANDPSEEMGQVSSAMVSWSDFGGCATDIAQKPNGHQTDDLWVVGCTAVSGGYKIYKWTGTSWTATAQAVGGMRIAVDTSGRPWIRDSAGTIKMFSNNNPATGTWQSTGTGCASDITAGTDGSIWIIGCAGGVPDSNDDYIYKRTGTTWTRAGSGLGIRIGAYGGRPVIDVKKNQTIWALSNTDPLTGVWKQTTGAAKDVGQTLVVGTDDRVWMGSPEAGWTTDMGIKAKAVAQYCVVKTDNKVGCYAIIN